MMRAPRAGGWVVLQALTLHLAAPARAEPILHWDYGDQGRDWKFLCRGAEQSPIDIEPERVKSSDLQIRVRYKLWRGEDAVPQAPRRTLDGNDVPRFSFSPGSSPGSVQVGTGYNNFDEYALTHVEVHSPSEHTFMQASWPVELQLWHEPMPLERIGRVAQRMGDLEESNRQVDGQLELLEEVERQLRDEYEGDGVQPSASADEVGWAGQQTMGLIQATKERIEEEMRHLRLETEANARQAKDLAYEAGRVAAAQRREYAAHRVVISFFVRRASSEMLEGGNQTVSQLLNWVTDAVSPLGSVPGELHAERLFESSASRSVQDEFYGYEGSLTRPPCTPNVRWFVTAKPLAAPVEAIERLLQAARLGGGVQGAVTDGVVGDSREIQAVGSGRDVWRVAASSTIFEEPVLNLPQSGRPDQGEEKWAIVQRYCKVFFMCSVLLLATPFFFAFIRQCREMQDEDEEDMLKEPGQEVMEAEADWDGMESPTSPAMEEDDDGLTLTRRRSVGPKSPRKMLGKFKQGPLVASMRGAA